MYTKNQLQAITNDFRDRVANEKVKPYEVVIALLVMEKAGDIKDYLIKDILTSVFKDKVVILEALDKALLLVDDKLIDSIIKDVKSR